MANVTAPQFQQDVNNTADWANGDENTTVTMRLGQQADSPAKVIKRVDDLAAAQREDIYENATPLTIGNFADGFTYTALNQRGEFGGDQYVFLGGLDGLPHVVAPATDPTLSPSLYAKANYNDAASVANANGGNVQNQLDIKDGLTVSEAINYAGIASLLGSRVWLTDRQAWFEVVLTSSGTPDVATFLQSTANPDYSLSIRLNGHATAFNFGCTCDGDDTSGTGTDDTVYNQLGAEYCRDNSLIYLVPANVLIDTFDVPSGLVMQSLPKGEQEYNFIQKIDSTSKCIDIVGASFSSKKFRIQIDGIRVKGFLASGTLGLDCADASFIDIKWMEVLGFDKGYSIRQLNDSTIGYLISRNCNHAGEFIAGDSGGAADDNTNNVIVNQLLAETYYISGLDIRGLGSGASLNNKISIQRVKCESGQLSAAATFGLRIRYLGTSNISVADSVSVNTIPPSSFEHFIMEDCASTTIENLELRSQTTQTFDDLATLANNKGCYLGVSHFVDGTINNQVVTDGLGNVGCAIRLINDVNASGSTFTNADVNSGLAVFENYNKFKSNMVMESDGEIYHEITRTGVATWRIGRIDGSGNIRISKDGATILTLTTSGNVVSQNGDFSAIPNGAGIIVRSPDGLTTRRIGIDNSGALSITTP